MWNAAIMLIIFTSLHVRLSDQHIHGRKAKSSKNSAAGLLVYGCALYIHWLQF